jgi:hypothetical protein
LITKTQLPEKQKEIIEKQIEKFKVRVFTEEIDEIPNVDDIPGEGSKKWLKIKDVICVFVDMKNSTKLSASCGYNSKKLHTIYGNSCKII